MPDFTTTQIAAVIAAFAGAYAAGSVNFSLLAARLLGHGDLRSHGSGNAGATNLARVAGNTAAATVLALDIARGAAVIFAASAAGLDPLSPLAAIPLLLGNMFPVFHGFCGGKGVAAAVGAMLVISPFTVLVGGGVFFAVFAIWRRVSLGSLVMVLAYPASTYLFGGDCFGVCAAGGLAVLLVASHRHNIARLAAGTEPKFGAAPRSSGAERRP
jgi:glycerol-3-phosphate acyltransferase PlsY